MTQQLHQLRQRSPSMADASLDALTASKLVGEAARYEEGLTARVAGLTLMMWGCVTFGLFFISYALAAGGSAFSPWAGVGVLAVVLAACIIATNLLWQWRALGANVGFHPWRIWSQGALLLVAGFAIMITLDPLVPTDSSVSLAFVAAFILLYLGIRLRRRWAGPPRMLAAAIMLLVVNLALLAWAPHSLPEPDARTHTMAALATSAAIFLPGYFTFTRA